MARRVTGEVDFGLSSHFGVGVVSLPAPRLISPCLKVIQLLWRRWHCGPSLWENIIGTIWHFVIVLHNEPFISAYFEMFHTSPSICNLITKTRTGIFFCTRSQTRITCILKHKFPILTKFRDTTCLLHAKCYLLERKRINLRLYHL